MGLLYQAPTLFAQNLDPISGGAGWVGAGLLGLLLGWLLLKHLPDMQRRDSQKDKDHRDQIREVTTDYKASLREILEHCEKETQIVITTVKEELQKFRQRGNYRPPQGQGES